MIRTKQPIKVTLETGEVKVLNISNSLSDKEIIWLLHLVYGAQSWLEYKIKKAV